MIITTFLTTIAILSVGLNVFLFLDKRNEKRRKQSWHDTMFQKGLYALKNKWYSVASRIFFCLLENEKTKEVHMKFVEALYGDGEYRIALNEIEQIFRYNEVRRYELSDSERLKINELKNKNETEGKAFKKHVEKGLNDFRMYNYEKAEEEFAIALRCKKDFSVYVMLIESLLKCKEIEKATQECENLESFLKVNAVTANIIERKYFYEIRNKIIRENEN